MVSRAFCGLQCWDRDSHNIHGLPYIYCKHLLPFKVLTMTLIVNSPVNRAQSMAILSKLPFVTITKLNYILNNSALVVRDSDMWKFIYFNNKDFITYVSSQRLSPIVRLHSHIYTRSNKNLSINKNQFSQSVSLFSCRVHTFQNDSAILKVRAE